MSLPLPSRYCDRCGYPLSHVRESRQEAGIMTYSGHCHACAAFHVVTIPPKLSPRPWTSSPKQLDAAATSQESRFSSDEATP